MAYTWILFGHTSVGAGQTYSLGEAYPTTRGGQTFGFSADLTANARDREASSPNELRGIVFQANASGMVQFRWNFAGAERTYNVRLAAGDWVSEQNQRIIIRDGTSGSVLATITATTGTGGALQWVDATGTVRTGDPRAGSPTLAASWINTNAPIQLTFTADHVVVEIATASASFSTTPTALALEPVATTPVITGPTGAAGAASITHAVNELQANAGTWSATGAGSWSLTGTDATELAIAAGVVTKASGNFDRETKASYSFNVVYGTASQAVTLNINNVNEAPTFSGPDISVPGLVVGTAMGSINAALLFADPDSGDTGTYSAVGTWPAGITVSSAGLISGTPTTAGTSSSLRVRRTDGGGLTADSNLFSITVSASSTPVSFAGTVGAQSGTVGSAFSWAGSALASFFSGSLTPFTYNVSAGSLPPGLSLNASTGVVTGTPTTAGTFNATFRAVDTGTNAATSNSVAFTIAAAPTAPGFDFHTAAGCIFGAISGSLVGLAREVGVSITTRVYNATTGALVATLPAAATDSNGRLPRLTDAALVAGTTYRLVFVWPDGSAYTINLAATA